MGNEGSSCGGGNDGGHDYSDRGSFGNAFAAAHNDMGPGHSFDYGGRSFSTDRADGRDVSAGGRGGSIGSGGAASGGGGGGDYSSRGSFGSAFAAAHRDMGPGHSFTYSGKSYSTERADGRDVSAAASRGAGMASFSRGSGRNTAPASTTTSERKAAIYSALNKELGHKGAVAVLANIAHETGETFDHKQKQVKGNAVGLVQMEPPMKKDYDKFLSERNKVDSPQSQVDYVVDQLKTGSYIGPGHAAKIRSAIKNGSIEEATKEFSNRFERPGVPHMDKRLEQAHSIDKEFKE